MVAVHRRDFLRVVSAGLSLPLLACQPGGAGRGAAVGGGRFEHGVASGDPLIDRVILWTRLTPQHEQAAPIPVELIVARDEDLAEPLLRVRSYAEAAHDFTVKLDVQGLEPGTTYHYVFLSGTERSPVGRTRTLPVGPVSSARLAVLTCGDYSRGLFNVYARVAERDDLDAVLHLGDYIYENDNTDRVRAHEPPRKCLTLEDYRQRYAQYRQDPDLAALHARHPVIWIWDDHEFANNAWREGADNHDPATDGDFADRDAAALTAALEWMPIRSPDPQRPLRIFRDFGFGELFDLFMLDTRRIGRDQPLPANTVFGDALPAFTQTGGFSDPGRQLLGPVQEAWLFDRLARSRARWRLIGNQVMMAQLKVAGAPEALGGGIYGNPDQWDGYKPARDRLLAHIGAQGIDNVVVLAGDFHVAFASDISTDPNNPLVYEPLTGEGALAVEFVTPSVSSAGDPPAPGVASLSDPEDLLEQLVVGNPAIFRAPNPHIKFSDGLNGYLILDITEQALRAEFWNVPQVSTLADGQELGAVFRVDAGRAALRREL